MTDEENMILLNDSFEKPLSGNSKSLGINILKELSKHYPALKGDKQSGWCVIINERNNIIQITNTFLNSQYGYVCHLSKVAGTDLKDIMRAGGEIMERFNVERTAINEEQALKNVKRDVIGRAKQAA